MTPAALLQRMATEGVQLIATPDRKIQVSGTQAAVTRWLPEINLRKAVLVAALCDPLPDIQDFLDAVEERAAILQFDAADVYPSREAAFMAAYEECKAKWRRA